MTGDAAAAQLPEAPARRRWLWALGLLGAEYVVALLFFDSERLPVGSDASGFAFLGESMSLAIVVMTAALVAGPRPSSQEMAAVAAAYATRRRIWPWLALHGLAYGVALGVTILVFNVGVEVRRPWFWVALWAGSGVCALFALLAALLPRAALRPLGKPVARALGSGLAVGVLAMVAGWATSFLWRPMSRMTLEVVLFFLRFTGAEIISKPADLVVGTPAFKVFIDRPCSGYEGIGLISVMLGLYLFVSRKSLRFPNALALLPVGMLLIWVANGFRIAALIAVGTWLSPAVAEGGFHSAAGWLLFCVITLALIAVSRGSRWFTADATAPSEVLQGPTSAFILPLMVLLATGLVSGLFIVDFDYLYPLRVLTPLLPLALLRRHYRGLIPSFSWAPIILGVVVFAGWVLLEPASEAEAAHPIPTALAQLPAVAAYAWLVLRVLGSSLVVPVVEELAFRGYLLRRLIDSDFVRVPPQQFGIASFIVSSAAFGVLHERWFAGILAGMVYAFAQYRRGEIGDAIIAHMLTNSLLAAYVLIGERWVFW